MENSASPAKTGDTLDHALLVGRSAFLGFLVKRLGNRADAEDVLQEFCIRVLARKYQLRQADRMDAWLYSVLRSALNDHYRMTGRRKRLGDAFEIETQTAEEIVDSSEAMAHMCGCVKGLVPKLRPADGALIYRIDIDEEDRASVAADLGLRPGTLAVRLHRARAALGDALLGHCGNCCKHGFEDCSCPPAGCENPDEATRCAGEKTTI
jgi:RNA polymerase sigma factor (sigma-70 family)